MAATRTKRDGRAGASRRRAAGAIACLVGCSLPSHARAQPVGAPPAAPPPASTRTSTLGWLRDAGAESCIGTIELAARVEMLLGRPVFVSAARAEVSVEGVVKPASPGFVATISVADAKGASLGSRTIETTDADCKGLADPVALAIALMIDPDAHLSPSGVAPPTPTQPPEVVVKEKIVERETKVYVPVPAPPVEPAPPPLVLHGYVGAALGLGLAPPSGGFTAGITIEPASFVPIGGSLTLILPNAADLERGATLAVTQFQAAGYVCPLAGRGSIVFGELCAGGQFGFLVAEGDGFTRDESQVSGLIGPAIEGRFGARVMAPFAVSVGGTFGVPLLRPTFVYDDGAGRKREAFAAAPVSGQFDVTVGVVVP